MIRTTALFEHNVIRSAKVMLLAGILSSIVLVVPVWAQSSNAVVVKPVVAGAPSSYRSSQLPKRAGEYYGLIWGVDSLGVRAVESGELIRFSFRVINADKAKPLNDKKIEPVLIAPLAGVKLVIPSLEKVGQLRQTGTPKVGESYWMAFSNPRRVVKRGDRVNVVIGHFKIEGLVVE